MFCTQYTQPWSREQVKTCRGPSEGADAVSLMHLLVFNYITVRK